MNWTALRSTAARPQVGKDTTKEELRESIAINKSLFALKQVFRCVAAE